MAMKPRKMMRGGAAKKMMRGGITETPMPMKKRIAAKMPAALKKAMEKKKMMRGGKAKK